MGVSAQQHTVSGEELHIADDGVTTDKFGENGGVLSSYCGAYSVITPVHAHDTIEGLFAITRPAGGSSAGCRRV